MVSPTEAEKGPKILQPATFLTERSKFETDTVHPSKREVHHVKEREITTHHRVADAVTHSGLEGDVPEPTEIIEEDDDQLIE